MPQLQVDDNVKEAIQNAVNSGKVVTVSKTNITLNGWTGCGYIITNPNTGAGAYMISGGFSGALMLIIAVGVLAMIIAGLLTGASFAIAALCVYAIMMPFYLWLLAWLATTASEKTRLCIAKVIAEAASAEVVSPIIDAYFRELIMLLVLMFHISEFIDCFGE